MNLVDQAQLLSAEEVQALAVRYDKTHDAAVEARLVRAHLRLVAKLARQVAGRSNDYEDLLQEGCLGLVEGIRKFDPARGVRLASYASWWIRARLFRHVIGNRRLVRFGTTMAQRKLFFNLAKARARLEHETGVEPSTEALAHALGVGEREVAEAAARLARGDASLDGARGDEAPLSRCLAGDDDPERTSARDELDTLVRGRVARFRGELGARDRAIFDARFNDDPKSLSALGRRFGVSRERVRQLEARILGKLKPELALLAA